MSPRISVSVRVTGRPLDIPAVEAAVGMQATKTWREGDAIQGSRLLRKQDGWEFRTAFQSGYLIEDEIINVHRTIGPRTADLRRLCDEEGYEIEVTCIVEMIDETAGLILSRSLILWLAELGASFQVDTYITAK